jgi:enterochelin esterase-like enzyme
MLNSPLVRWSVAFGLLVAFSHAQGQTREELVSVTHARIQSKALRASRDVYVWLPDGAVGSSTRYPVLVLLDAQDRNQFRSALANIRFLMDRHVVPPLLVIGVPFGAARDAELTPPVHGSVPPYMQALGETPGQAEATTRFVVDELLPWADAHYPTSPVRLLAGHSLGGLLSLYAAAMRPGVFRVVIAMSPSLWWDNGTIGAELAPRLAADTTHLHSLFLTSGGLEGGLDQATTQFTALLRSLVPDSSAARFAFTHQRYERSDHSMTPLASLIDGLQWAYAPLRVPIDSVFGALMAGGPKDSTTVLAAQHALEAQYRVHATALGVPDLPFPEYALNLLGYYCTQAKLLTLANQLFRENTQRYSKSSNAYESLAEGLLAVGDTSGAVHAFHQALAASTRDDDANAIASHAILHRLGKS